MPQRSIIQFYDGSGTSELANLWDIFSSVPVARGTTSSTKRFRVYNNYSGTADIVDANDVQVQISGSPEFLTDQVIKQELYDYTRELILGGYVEIRCTLASETGLVPPSGSSFVPLIYGTGFSGSGFDTIVASGSFNYNEYELQFNIPASGTSGSWVTSGSIYPSFFVDYTNDGFASDR